MSLFHRHRDDAKEAVAPPPPSAVPPAVPPSPEEIDEVTASTKLKHQLDDGVITQAEYDAHKGDVGHGG